jgi:hypothetical protein
VTSKRDFSLRKPTDSAGRIGNAKRRLVPLEMTGKQVDLVEARNVAGAADLVESRDACLNGWKCGRAAWRGVRSETSGQRRSNCRNEPDVIPLPVEIFLQINDIVPVG